MIIHRITPPRNTRIPNVLYCILRGAILGCIFGILTNFNNLSCLLSEEALLAQLKREDEANKVKSIVIPKIPDEYRANLSKPVDPLLGEESVLLVPQKIVRHLAENKLNTYHNIFIIPLSPRDVVGRFSLRRHWTLVTEIEGKRIGYFFITTKSASNAPNKLLAKENEVYEDILQTSLSTDSKDFGSQIILAGYQWALSEIGPRSTFYTSVTSDIFVDVPNVYEYLEKIEREKAYDKFHCGYHMSDVHGKPRNPASPYYVPDDVYKEPAYPPYCNLDMVITSHDLLQKFYDVARFTKRGPLPNGSAYLWGVIREKLRGGAKNNLILAKEFADDKRFLPLGYQIDVVNVKVSNAETNRLWEGVKKRLDLEDERQQQGDKDFPRRKAKVAAMPTTDENSSPVEVMKIFMNKWRMMRDG